MGTTYLPFAAVVACLCTASPILANIADPAFEAYKPQVLVTPDNLPILSWKDPDVDRQIDPSELTKLNVCIPGACSQEALDAGAAYYQILVGLIAYYDQYGRLVGTSNQLTSSSDAGPSIVQATGSDSTFTDAGVPQLDTLIGATPGAFEPMPSGAATYRIPIDIQPGTAGTQPKLALSCNSQGGNGLLGVGWSLEGLSGISRCPQTYAQDSNQTGLTFTSTDRFCLDGKRLIRTGGATPYGASGSEYRTEVDTFTKIVYQKPASGPDYFRVWTKSGEVMEYGNTDDSNINTENHNVAGAWALNRVADTAGNFFRITYIDVPGGGEYRPSVIEYTGSVTPDLEPYASVSFVYESRPDPSVGFRANARLATAVRMKSVITKVGLRVVRVYNLLYDATTADKPLSRLTHVQVCANGAAASSDAYIAQCLPETSFAWQDYPSGFDGVKNTTHSADRIHERTYTMDVNGDGRDDIVYEHNGTWRILFANAGQGFNPAVDTTKSTPSQKVTVFDYDGDGRQDLAELPPACIRNTTLEPPCPSAKVTVLKSNGTGFTRVSTDIEYSVGGGARSFKGIRTGDLSGDGWSDLLIGETHANKLVIYLNLGSSFARHETGLGDDWIEDLSPLEFDGDGQTDFMRLRDGVWHVLKSGATGTDFQLIDSGIPQHALQLADVNGDGLQDAVVDSGGKFAIRLNRGGAFSDLVLTNISTGDDAKSLLYALVLDFNADGRQDLYAPIAGKWQALRSTPLGNGFDLPPTGVDDTGHRDSPQVGDFDGDGLVDVALDSGATWHLLFHRLGNSNHISAVDAGGERFNDLISVTYSPLTDGSVYTLGVNERLNPAFPNARGIEAPLYVVSSYRRSNGLINPNGSSGMREYTYRYTDARINMSGRGFLGFATQTVTDVAADLMTVTAYHQDYPYTGLIKQVVTRLVDDADPLSTATNAYDKVTTTGAAVYPYLKTGTQKTFDPEVGTLLVTTTTDTDPPTSHGNFRHINVQITDNTGTHTTGTVNAYDSDDAAAWRLGRLTRSQVTHTNPAGQTLTRVSSFEYYPVTDLLWKETVQPGSVHELITTYGRDEFGNIDATTLSTTPGATIAPRTSKTQYNGLGRYLFRVENAEGHVETHAHDRHHGVITSLTGPNGLKTEWIYDSLGRQDEEIRADGTKTDINYAWCTSVACPNVADIRAALYRKTIITDGAPTVVEYYDASNRVVAIQQVGFSGTVLVQTVYTAREQVDKVSRPYFVGDPPAGWIDYTYDVWGRLTDENSPITGHTSTDYTGLKTKVTNAKGQQTTETKNGLGQTVEMLDDDNHRTIYAYDPVGNLLKVTDSEDNETTNKYNIRGHKFETDDPDMGL